VNTFGTRSWIAFILTFSGEVAGLYWMVSKGASPDWRLFAVYSATLCMIQVIITGRSILEDVKDVVQAWKGTGGSRGPDSGKPEA
jgi:hypothetical protein